MGKANRRRADYGDAGLLVRSAISFEPYCAVPRRTNAICVILSAARPAALRNPPVWILQYGPETGRFSAENPSAYPVLSAPVSTAAMMAVRWPARSGPRTGFLASTKRPLI